MVFTWLNVRAHSPSSIRWRPRLGRRPNIRSWEASTSLKSRSHRITRQGRSGESAGKERRHNLHSLPSHAAQPLGIRRQPLYHFEFKIFARVVFIGPAYSIRKDCEATHAQNAAWAANGSRRECEGWRPSPPVTLLLTWNELHSGAPLKA
jgi:hypothetical protein